MASLLYAQAASGQCELQKFSAPSDPLTNVVSFGASASINGDRIIVGAFGSTQVGVASSSGAALVFRRDDNGTPSNAGDDFWVQEQKLTASDAAAGDEFGLSVGINGDRIVVGAHADDDAGESSGSAYVLRRDDNGTPFDPNDDSWIQVVKLTALDASAGDYFGRSVSISGDRAVVGAQYDSVGTGRGSAYVFAVGTCLDELGCDDGDVCTFDECCDDTCFNTPNTYGDVNHDGNIDIFDLFCILDGFAGDFSVCSLSDDDIDPCTGDSDVDLFDLFAVRNAFSGTDPCCGGLP